MADNKEDKGFIVMGPELENGGRAALRVDKDGAHPGEMFAPGTAPMDAEGDFTRIKTEQISGPIYQVTDEDPIIRSSDELIGTIGRPSMVNSRAYRDNWDNIFGNKQVVGES